MNKKIAYVAALAFVLASATGAYAQTATPAAKPAAAAKKDAAANNANKKAPVSLPQRAITRLHNAQGDLKKIKNDKSGHVDKANQYIQGAIQELQAADQQK